jgi:hypothetical protein
MTVDKINITPKMGSMKKYMGVLPKKVPESVASIAVHFFIALQSVAAFRSTLYDVFKKKRLR